MEKKVFEYKTCWQQFILKKWKQINILYYNLLPVYLDIIKQQKCQVVYKTAGCFLDQYFTS